MFGMNFMKKQTGINNYEYSIKYAQPFSSLLTRRLTQGLLTFHYERKLTYRYTTETVTVVIII